MNITGPMMVARPEPGLPLPLELPQSRIALRRVEVQAEVRDVAVHLTLTQVYRNDENRPIEALYCFPVDEGAAVCGFRIETGDRVLIGTAEEKDGAFELYDQAIERGDGAFLADLLTDDILTVSVGNLKPGQEARVQLRTVSELPVSDGVMRLTIPSSISPRYAPAGMDPTFVDRLKPDYVPKVPYRLSLEVRVLAEAVRAVRSPSHRVAQRADGAWTVVRLEGGSMGLDRDFVLELERVSARGAVSYASRHANGERAVLLRFYPELPAPQGAPGNPAHDPAEVVFVLDCSGSMQGSSIREAKQALELCLRTLEEGDRFNIVRFGSRFEAWREHPVSYDRSSLEEALRYLHGLDADLGGTEILSALQFACGARPPESKRREVVLLTDGEVANPDAVIALARDAATHTRFFSFGIGYGASHALVKGVARASGGAWEMIHPGEAIQPKVLRHFARLTQPRLEEVRVEMEGGTLELPGPLPPVFEGDSVTVFARLVQGDAEGATVRFIGTLEGRPCSWSAPVVETGEDDAIPCLWAKARIRELKAGLHEGGGSNQAARREMSVERQITELGQRFCLLTDYTSFVAVEERPAAKRTAGRPEYRRIPVLLTRDYHGTANYAMELMMEPRFALARGQGEFDAYDLAIMDDWKPERESAWYLQLLATQQAEGWFEGWEIPAERLSLSAEDLEQRMLTLAEDWGLPADMEEWECDALLVTWLAIRLLSEDPEAAAASQRAVAKARKWLEETLEENEVEQEKIEELLAASWALRAALHLNHEQS